MRNGFRTSRTHPNLTLQPLEPRTLLSSTLPGAPFSTGQMTVGEIAIDSLIPAIGAHTRLLLYFSRTIDSTAQLPTDFLYLELDLSDATGQQIAKFETRNATPSPA